MRTLVQPHDWPWTIASISALDAKTVRPALKRSGTRRASGSRDSLRTRAARTTVTRPTGRLTRNTHRQLACTRSAPIGGPAAAAMAPVADHTATASARCFGGNSASTSASEAGIRIAPPAACRTRAAINQPAPGAAAHSAEANTKVTRPATKSRLRPNRSAMRPAGTSSAAVTIAYPLRTQESVASLVPAKSRWMLGKAMLTMKRSRLATKVATETITRTR